MKLILVVAAVVAAVCLQCDAKTFTRCELVRELRKQNFPARQLSDWVCLVEAESGRHTHVIQGHYHGLYQIDDRVWCNNSNTPGKNCNATCAQLRTDDITRASTCAKRIFQQHGFSWWGGWVTRCRSLPDISNC